MSSITSGNALAIRAASGFTYKYAVYALLVGLGVLAIAVSAKIQVPFWPVPMTLQTLAIMAIFAAYGLRLSVATIIAYFAAGTAGLPVYAGAVAGPAYLVGPTGGFLAGFVIAAFIVGYVADQTGSKNPFKLFAAMVTADVVIFALGFLWLGFIFNGGGIGADKAWLAGVQPYILSDIVKMVIAAAIVPAVASLLKR